MHKFQIAILVAGLFACSAASILPPIIPETVTGLGSLVGTVPSTLSGLSTASIQLLNGLPLTAQANVLAITNALYAVEQANGNVEVTKNAIFQFAVQGLYLNTDGNPNSNATNSVGAISLPTATLCQLGAQYLYSSCYVCNTDCYVAHNLWGGSCGASPITGNQTCLCANSAAEAAAKGYTIDSNGPCGSINLAISKVESFAIATAFRTRYTAVQCTANSDGSYNDIGCNTDCVQNHGFVSGHCQLQVPNVPMYPTVYSNGNDKPNVFCVCSATAQPDTTYDYTPTSN